MEEKDRIKAIRKEFGMTLVQFGERLGVTNAAISMVENGKNAVSEQLRKAICREFDINENWLRTGEGEMKAETDDEYMKLCVDVSLNDEYTKRAFMAFCKIPIEQRKTIWETLKKLTDAITE